jgi:hypothetical protein
LLLAGSSGIFPYHIWRLSKFLPLAVIEPNADIWLNPASHWELGWKTLRLYREAAFLILIVAS